MQRLQVTLSEKLLREWGNVRVSKAPGNSCAREALLSEVCFEKVFRTHNWVRRSCFVDDFVPCWGKRGACPLLLEPGGS